MKKTIQCIMLLLILVAVSHCSREDGKDGLNGINGRDGIDGRDGRNGADGTRILSGRGEPSAYTGNIGDFYLDFNTKNLYGPKTHRGWGSPISLKGQDGRDGRDGADGQNGRDGQDGRNGADGQNGRDGRDGKDGKDGKDGSKIYAGITPPDSSLGKEGDWYIDKVNKKLYGPKNADGWGNGISLGGEDSPISGGNYHYLTLERKEVYVQQGNTVTIQILSGSENYTITPNGNNATVQLATDKQSIKITGTSVGDMSFLITDNIAKVTLKVSIKVLTKDTILKRDYTLSADGRTLVKWNNRDTKSINMQSDPHLRNVTKIADKAFKDTRISHIVLPQQLIEIGSSAFEGADLFSINIPNGVTRIGYDAFSRNARLTSAIIPNSITRIEGNTFRSTSLASITIPNSVTRIENSAFSSTSLTSITIPNSVTYIGDRAFSSTKLTSITIPNSVTHIGDGAFENNSHLTSVIIPNSVTHIGSGSFHECYNLTAVYIEREQPPTITGFYYYLFSEATYRLEGIYVPRQSVETYKRAKDWKEYAQYIKAR